MITLYLCKGFLCYYALCFHFFLLILFLLSSSLIPSVSFSFGNIPSNDFIWFSSFKSFRFSTCFCPWSSLYYSALKYDWVIKTREFFNFLPLIKKSVTIEFSFLLLIISAIISSKPINILRSLSVLDFSIFL